MSDQSAEFVTIACVGKDCVAKIRLPRITHDQEAACAGCGTRFVYYGVVEVQCPSCASTIEASLTGAVSIIHCDTCRTQANVAVPDGAILGTPARPFEEIEGAYYYCGLESFSGFDEQPGIADAAFGQIERRVLGLFRRTPKRLVFFNIVERSMKSGPKLRFLHATCNYKHHSAHRNAKFMTLVFGPSLLKVFRELVDKGVTDIWFPDAQTKGLVAAIPDVQRYSNRFRALEN